MLVPFAPAPRDVAADALLGELPRELFTDRLYEACELVERYVSEQAVDIARRLELTGVIADGGTAAEIAARGGLSGDEAPALLWLLRRLAEAGHLVRELETGGERFRSPAELPPAALAELREIGLAIDPAIRPTLAILDAAAETFPAVVSGRSTGEQTLFSGARMQLWLDYFHNANPIYALNNRIAAVAAANRLPERGAFRILEVGAGAGSAAESLLDEIAARGRLADLAEYRLTEPNGLLRRRATRALAARFPGLPLADQAFDVDLDAAAQGLAPATYDLALAVNVLHIARDLGSALERLRDLLVPGGWLVGGECLRLFPGQTIAVELVFQQLRSFTRVELDPELRPEHGFLSPETWRRAFAAARLDEVTVVPELERIRSHHPHFFTGAICGRRPPE